jgi:hypothetical protein
MPTLGAPEEPQNPTEQQKKSTDIFVLGRDLHEGSYGSKMVFKTHLRVGIANKEKYKLAAGTTWARGARPHGP